MKQNKHFEYTTGVIAYPILFVLIIWLVFWFEVRFGFKFSKFGVYPQTLSGLRGVVLSPFLHGDIRASGLIYVLVSFTFFKGVFAKHYRLIALSLLVVFLYGSMIWYTLPIEEGISWEGHLSGLITGLLFALIFKKHIAKPKKYVWEEAHYNEDDDPFLKHFDEDGNFIEHSEPEIEPDELKIIYTFKEKKESS